MPADMVNATGLAIPPTVTWKQPIQFNYQNELASEDIYSYLIHWLGQNAYEWFKNLTSLITGEIKLISMKNFPIVSRKEAALVKMF